MEHKVQFLSLQKAELEYEVAIRGESPAKTVEGLRKQIVDLIKHPLLQEIMESHLSPLVDLKELEISLSKLETNINDLKAKFDKNLYLRTNNLLNHLYLRIARIQPVTPDEVKMHLDLNSILSTYSMELNSLVPFSSQSVTAEQYLTNPISKAPEALAPPTNISVTCDRGIGTDVSKLKFDGHTCVRAFIQKVDEFMLARNIDSKKIMCFATEIFSGNALHWYRSIRDSTESWTDLVLLLKQDFDPVDYDYRLMAEIHNRTQGETENITIYFAIMSGMFSRLSEKLSEDKKLQILLHNIRPCYTDTLAANPDIGSVETLRAKCRNYEIFQSRRAQFREPPKQTSDTLAPEFAYRPSYSNSTRNSPSYKAFPNAAIDSAVNAISSSSNSKPLFCPRCRSNNHSLSMCQEPRTPVCFKCGKKDVIFPNCPVCNQKN